jgi:predicted DNA binding CopG/RHH family protein
MATWPPPSGQRAITLNLREEHVAHIDAQAAYEGCSRAAYIRQLIVRDMERQGPTRRCTPHAGQG